LKDWVFYPVFEYHHKKPIKDQWPKPIQGRQRESQERPKGTQPARTKKIK
jgi:hypothetical protein